MEHTKGEWGNCYDRQSDQHLIFIELSGNSGSKICHIAAVLPDIIAIHSRKEFEANARLIAEAGTVTNETGFTPKQLAEQKADLLEACEGTEPWCLRQYAERANELASKPNLSVYRVILSNIGGMFEILTTEAEKRQAAIAKAKN